MALIEHLEKLRHFYSVTQFRSINEAAQKIGISQGGLSKSIASLEKALDIDLFVRSRDGLILTGEGEKLRFATKQILHQAHEIEAQLQALKAPTIPAKIRIGMYDSIAVYFGTTLSNYLQAVYPSLTLEITADTSAALLDRLKSNQLDLAVGVNFENTTEPSLQFFKLFDDYYSFYVSPSMVKQADKLPFLIHEKTVSSSGTPIKDFLKQSIKNRGIHYILNFETLKILAVQGLGIGVLPTQVAKPLVKSEQLVNIHLFKNKNLFCPHSIGFLASKKLIDSHNGLANDIYRLGENWSKS